MKKIENVEFILRKYRPDPSKDKVLFIVDAKDEHLFDELFSFTNQVKVKGSIETLDISFGGR